jgi:hypothetical protein
MDAHALFRSFAFSELRLFKEDAVIAEGGGVDLGPRVERSSRFDLLEDHLFGIGYIDCLLIDFTVFPCFVLHSFIFIFDGHNKLSSVKRLELGSASQFTGKFEFNISKLFAEIKHSFALFVFVVEDEHMGVLQHQGNIAQQIETLALVCIGDALTVTGERLFG